MPLKVAFLDRDGTINVDHGYVYRVEDWQFTERAVDAIRLLREAGFAVAVVTNQSGIAAGHYSQDDLQRLHHHLHDELAKAGTQVDALASCPHGSAENCDCRKPRTGMIRQIEAVLGKPIDFAASWTIGDKPADVGFGRGLGTQTALLRSRYWNKAELSDQPNLIADSLYEAVMQILKNSQK